MYRIFRGKGTIQNQLYFLFFISLCTGSRIFWQHTMTERLLTAYKLTPLCLPLKTKANAPWPRRSPWLYSNSFTLCIISLPSRLSPLVWLAEGQTPSLSPVQLTLNSAAIYTDSSPLRFLHAWGGHHLRTGTPLEDKKKQVKTSLTLNFCMHHKTTYLLLSSSDLLSPSRYCTVSWPSFKTANSQLCCDLAIARRDRSRLDAIVYVR